MGEYEVVEADLSSQQHLHVYFVRVECAEEDLDNQRYDELNGDTLAELNADDTSFGEMS